MDKKVNAFYFKLSFPIKKEDIKPVIINNKKLN